MRIPDPFILCLALLPIIGYLLVLGVIRLSGRAMVTTGSRELAALGLAVAGFVAIGPAQLFFPVAAGTLFGPWVWALIGIFYLLCVTLVSLTTQPRLAVHGLTSAELMPYLIRATKQLDGSVEVNEKKQQVYLPSFDTRLRIDSLQGIDHCSILAFESTVPPVFWEQLLSSVRREILQHRVAPGTRGLGMVISAILLIGFILVRAIPDQELLVEGFRQWLFR